MATIPLQEPAYRGHAGPVFFAAGFRPFFLFAGIQAAVMLPLWLLVFHHGLDLGLSYPPAVWHGHELVFGFGVAAVGGFLLTAVPNWTNMHHVSGRPLMALFGLWLAGRVAFSLGGVLPAALVALLDLAYLPVLAAMMAGPLIKAGKWRNIAFLPILAALWMANAMVHLDIVLGVGEAMTGVYLGIFLLLMMIAIVGGRIVPSFTLNYLRMQGRPLEARTHGWVEKGGAVGSLAAAAALTLVAPGSVAAGVALLVAAAIHGLRLAGWHGAKTLKSPLLWVLHLGYLWLVVGLALLGLSSFIDALPVSAALHALTAGSIGTMILAVMSRAALGHSGRPLQAAPATVAAYVLLSLGTVLRVVSPLVPEIGLEMTGAAGLCWAGAWVLFVFVYAPIVARPRADGRAG